MCVKSASQRGFYATEDAVVVLVLGDVSIPVLSQKIGHILRLVVPHFKQERPLPPQGQLPVLSQVTVERQTICPAVQRQQRFSGLLCRTTEDENK